MRALLSFLAERAYAASAQPELPVVKLTSKGFVPQLANKILDLLTILAYPLAFIAIAYTAYVLINSAGKPEAMATARKNLTYIAIGIFLIVFAAIFVRFALSLFKI